MYPHQPIIQWYRSIMSYYILNVNFIISRGEHIFDLLVSMETRSNHDHIPWHGARSEGRRTKPDGYTFVHKALVHVVKLWALVKPSLAAGLEPGKPVTSHQGNTEGHWLLTVAEQNKILYNQSQVQHLDVLIYSLVAKLPRVVCHCILFTYYHNILPLVLQHVDGYHYKVLLG